MGYSKILVPVDFSDKSRHALETALEIAAFYKSDVIVCHVIPLVMVASPLFPHYSAQKDRDREEEEEKAALLEVRKLAGQVAGRELQMAILRGDAPAEIVSYAEHEGCDLIVMSSTGRTGLKRMLLGSVADRVIRHAHCGVLVVR